MRRKQDTGISEHSGFPNAATDSTLGELNLSQLLLKNPVSTYFMRIEGHQWQEQGIFNGDVAVVDRALKPRATDRVIWWLDDSFVIDQFSQLPEEAEPWGVVTSIIHRYRT